LRWLDRPEGLVLILLGLEFLSEGKEEGGEEFLTDLFLRLLLDTVKLLLIGLLFFFEELLILCLILSLELGQILLGYDANRS
jgi:hypothetical protein